MKNKFKSFGFWSALAGAVVVLLNALGRAFGFAVQEELVTDIIMAVAGVLVVLGVVTMPKGEAQKTSEQNDVNQGEKQEENQTENSENAQTETEENQDQTYQNAPKIESQNSQSEKKSKTKSK